MRSYPIYKNIRKGAVIWGLPISLFALLIASVICSLMVIIFSFSVAIILGLFIWNGGLYVGLTRWQKNKGIFQIGTAFPKHITNKKENLLRYVNY